MNYESSFSRQDAIFAQPAEKIERTKRRIWPALLGLLAIAAIITAAYFAFANKSGVDAASGTKTAAAKPAGAGDKDKEAPNVTVIVPGRSTVANIVNATGSLAARRDLPIGAVGEGGLVTRVLVEPGQWVQAGQVLAVVDRQSESRTPMSAWPKMNWRALGRWRHADLCHAPTLTAKRRSAMAR
jgi:HlyD family secretion protein